MRTLEHVYIGRDNAIDVVLLSGDTVVSLASVTRMTLRLGSVIIDSRESPGVFDWATTVSAEEAAASSHASEGDSKLVVSLGGQDITPDIYEAVLTVYDADHESGIVWGSIPIRVISA